MHQKHPTGDNQADIQVVLVVLQREWGTVQQKWIQCPRESQKRGTCIAIVRGWGSVPGIMNGLGKNTVVKGEQPKAAQKKNSS